MTIGNRCNVQIDQLAVPMTMAGEGFVRIEGEKKLIKILSIGFPPTQDHITIH